MDRDAGVDGDDAEGGEGAHPFDARQAFGWRGNFSLHE
jgi:hypothetical protein